MNKDRTVCKTWMSGLVAVVMGWTALAVNQDNITFYCSFDNGFEADVAKGEKTARKVGEPTLVEGKFGKAVVLEHLANGLVFPTKGNVPMGGPQAGGMGTIAFWLSPIEWDAMMGQDLFFPILGSKPEGDTSVWTVQLVWPLSSVCLFHWPQFQPNTFPAGGFPACREPLVPLKADTSAEAMNSLRPGTWYHIAFTWRDGRIQGYRNGQLTGSFVNGAIRLNAMGSMFSLGYGGWDQPLFLDPGCDTHPKVVSGRVKHWRYIVDDLAIFDRALFPEQILKLYQGGKSALAYAQAGDVEPAVLESYYYNHKNQLVTRASCVYLPDQIKEVRLEIREENSLFPLQAVPMAYDQSQKCYYLRYDACNLPEQRFDVQAVIIGKDGKTLMRSNLRTFNRRVPIWFHNVYGTKDEVLPPWTPVKADKDSTSIWGRRYVYGPDLTLKELHTQGAQILARPMKLGCVIGGQAVSFALETQTNRPTGTTDFRRNLGKLGPLSAELKATTGFDGFMRWDLRLRAETPVTVDKLFLEIPLKKEHAQWFHAPNRFKGKAPDKPISGQFPFDYGLHDGGVTWTLAFHDSERGFQWAMESAQYWSNADPHKQIEVIPADSEMLLRFNLIDTPTALSSPVSYSFAFEGLPAKPLFRPFGDAPWPFIDKEAKISYGSPVPAVRLYTGYDAGLYLKENRVVYPNYGLSSGGWGTGAWVMVEGKNVWSPQARDFGFTKDLTPEELAPYYWRPDQRPTDNNWINYMGMGDIWACNSQPPHELTDVADIYTSDWARRTDVLPPRQKLGDNGIVVVCPSMPGYQDYLAFWTHKRAMEAPGIYFDLGSPDFCSNTEHGHGWRDAQGVLHPVIPIFAARECQMRAYAAFKEVKPHGIMIQHVSGQVFMGTDAFCDYKYDGENMQWAQIRKLREENDNYWSESLNLEYGIVEYDPRPWGYGPMGCWQFYGEVNKPGMDFNAATEYLRINMADRLQTKYLRDFRTVLFLIGRPNELGAYDTHLNAWGWQYPMEEVTQFVGCWRQKAFAGLGALQASYYPAGQCDRLMVTVGNLTLKDAEATITVDVEQIVKESGKNGFSHDPAATALSVQNVETDAYLPVDGNKMKLAVGKKDYQNLLFKWSKPPEPKK